MDTLSYHIVIKTHAGYRVGDLSVDLEDEKVSGTIHAPFFEPQFCGKMNDDGTLSLNLTVNADETRRTVRAPGASARMRYTFRFLPPRLPMRSTAPRQERVSDKGELLWKK